MKAKWFDEVATVMESEDFHAWLERLNRARREVRLARQRYEEVLTQVNLVDFRAELAHRRAIETLERANRLEDDSAALANESAQIENASFEAVSRFEEQRTRCSAIWGSLGAIEVDIEEGRDVEKNRRLRERLVQEYEREDARKQRYWNEVEELWVRTIDRSLALHEKQQKAKIVRAEAEELFQVQSREGEQAEMLRVEAEKLESSLAGYEKTLAEICADARQQFECLLHEDFLYWSAREDNRVVYLTPLMHDSSNYSIVLRPGALYQCLHQEGLGTVEERETRWSEDTKTALAAVARSAEGAVEGGADEVPALSAPDPDGTVPAVGDAPRAADPGAEGEDGAGVDTAGAGEVHGAAAENAAPDQASAEAPATPSSEEGPVPGDASAPSAGEAPALASPDEAEASDSGEASTAADEVSLEDAPSSNVVPLESAQRDEEMGSDGANGGLPAQDPASGDQSSGEPAPDASALDDLAGSAFELPLEERPTRILDAPLPSWAGTSAPDERSSENEGEDPSSTRAGESTASEASTASEIASGPEPGALGSASEAAPTSKHGAPSAPEASGRGKGKGGRRKGKRHRREPLEVRVELRSDVRTLVTTSRNVAAGGISLEHDERWSIGERLNTRLYLPSDTEFEPLQMVAEVVWADAGARGWKIGLAFRDFEPGHEARLKSWLLGRIRAGILPAG